MREGSGSGFIRLTSGSGSGRPKNMWIRWIRIRIQIQNRKTASHFIRSYLWSQQMIYSSILFDTVEHFCGWERPLLCLVVYRPYCGIEKGAACTHDSAIQAANPFSPREKCLKQSGSQDTGASTHLSTRIHFFICIPSRLL